MGSVALLHDDIFAAASACFLTDCIAPCLGVAQAGERPATVLLITSSELAPAWQGWVDLKTRLGLATKVVTVDHIAQRYPGEDIKQDSRLA